MSVSGEIPEIDRQIDIQHIIFYGLILVFVGDLVVYEEKWESKCSDRQMDRHATYYGLIGGDFGYYGKFVGDLCD